MLLARIRALLRRNQGVDSKQPEQSDGYPDELNFGGLSISRQAHRVSLESKTIDLTTNESELLAPLLPDLCRPAFLRKWQLNF